ncbi:MAG: hypothetical protein HY752_00885 [Nitrospirae bacterium]|nr:hypothetical protein [Nitrospirota bacterium]
MSIGKTSSGNNKSINITFTPPSDAKECGKYVLVFKGQMGNEQGAVVGKVVNTAENCSSLTIVDKDGTPATDTILRNGTLDFKTTDGCCGDIVWSVSVEAGSTLGGSTITQAGVLTAGATACGSLTVTATCLACGTSATQYVRVTNAGRWVWVEMCSGEDPQCGGEECIFISGQYRYSAYILYKYPPESCSWCLASCQTYGCTNNSPQIICGAQSSAKYQWQC